MPRPPGRSIPYSRHPGRSIPFPSSPPEHPLPGVTPVIPPEHPLPVIPAGAQRRAGIQRTPAAAPRCPVPPGPRGSRIKSGMTALGPRRSIPFPVIPAGDSRHPGPPLPVIPAGASPSRHPGRSAAESRDPADACRSPRVSGSPRPPWIPDQVRDDGFGASAGAEHPLPVIPAGAQRRAGIQRTPAAAPGVRFPQAPVDPGSSPG
jgi:hypothetical protein